MYSDIIMLPGWVMLAGQFILYIAMGLSLWRLIKGPSTPDRIVALDLLSALFMAKFVILVFQTGFVSFLDVATAIAVISFLATVAFARYLEDRQAPE